ncbi:MAG: sulfate ABC transporter permease subunit CysT [Micropepsaceae bacterium]
MTALTLGRARPRRHTVLPGFGLTMGFTLFYLSLVVLVPLIALIVRPWELGWDGFWKAISEPQVWASLKLSFAAALIAAAINAVFGLLLAWVLVRYRFPGRRLLDAAIDLPFALPTAVAGIAFATLYSPRMGWLGEPLKEWFGVTVAFTPAGIVIALIFIGLPFVVRSVQPVLEDLERDQEEAAATLGAKSHQTFFRVIMPALLPAWFTGFALAFARAVGEYGSVIFIAGNKPMVSEIAPLKIIQKLESYDYAGASAIGVTMLAASFVILLSINLAQRWVARR